MVNKEDPNWWQVSQKKKPSTTNKCIVNFLIHLIPRKARKVVGGAAGLIPSQFLEEKRKAFVRRDWDAKGTGPPLFCCCIVHFGEVEFA